MFSRRHSTITKGILIILMLAHHVFSPDLLTLYEVKTLLHNPATVTQIVTFFKICVPGFSFISAFGITRALQNKTLKNPAEGISVILKRLIKLESAVIIIYLLAVLYKQFVMRQPIAVHYAEADMDITHILLCMFIDGLGLATYMGITPVNVTWWYLSYAILLIAVMPLVYKAYEKYRYLLLPAACMIPLVIPGVRIEFWCYLPTVFLGCAFAYENWFERLLEWKQGNKLIKAGKFLACLFFLYLSYLLGKYTALEFSYLFVFVIPYMVYEFIASIPVLNLCLEFLGKYATDIFLIHTFIYYYFYPEFIYSFQSTWKILPVLLCLCLIISILIESIKKYTGYNKLTEKLLHAAENRFFPGDSSSL